MKSFAGLSAMSTKKVAIVTGANKGIGFAIVQGLCEQWKDGDVYLTSRDISRGQKAVADLNKLGLHPKFHQLDITDDDSIKKLRDHIKEQYGGIDILVNNAAVGFPTDGAWYDGNVTLEEFSNQAEQTAFVNYFSVLSTCKILFPILKPKASVVQVTSALGHPDFIPNEELRKKFTDNNLTEAVLSDLVKEFVKSSKEGKNIADGWGKSPYNVSKVALNALTWIQNREFGSKGFYINAVHPGYVDTDMSQHKGPLTIEEGAKAPIHLALDSEKRDYKGVFMWCDCSLVDWFTKLNIPIK